MYTRQHYYIYQSASDALQDTPTFVRTAVRFLLSWTFYVPMVACMGFVGVLGGGGNRSVVVGVVVVFVFFFD